jgi:hypothetical protein
MVRLSRAWRSEAACLTADPELFFPLSPTHKTAPLRPPHRGSPTYLELYTHLRAIRACLWLANFQRNEQRRTASATPGREVA